jgi:transcriptional regulator with GAF, ATPase, and Fis domain
MGIASLDWFTIGQTVGAFVVGIGVGIVPKIIRWFKGKNKVNNNDKYGKYQQIFNIKDVAEDDLKMQDLVTELRMTYDCDRSFVYLYHNGGSYLDGSPMKKTSMLYESVRRGVSYEAANSRDLSVSTMSALTDIISSEESQLIIVKDMKEDFFKHFLESRNVTASAYCPLKKGPQIIGFVGMHYCDGSDVTSECMKDLKNLERYASTIEVCLMERFKHTEKY